MESASDEVNMPDDLSAEDAGGAPDEMPRRREGSPKMRFWLQHNAEPTPESYRDRL